MAEHRRRAQGLAVREQLITAACARIAQVGYDAAGVAELAAAAGVSRNQLFHHFGSKEGLGAAAVERCARAWRDLVIAPAQIYPQPQQRLREMLKRYGELAAAGWVHDRLLAALAIGLSALPPALATQTLALLDELRRALSTPLKEMRDGAAGAAAAGAAAGAASGSTGQGAAGQVRPALQALRPKRVAAAAISLIIGAAALRDSGDPFGDAAAITTAAEALLGLPPGA